MALLERSTGASTRPARASTSPRLGISTAGPGLEQAVGMLDSSFPHFPILLRPCAASPNDSAGWRSNWPANFPKATQSLQELSPELSSVVGILDERFAHLDDCRDRVGAGRRGRRRHDSRHATSPPHDTIRPLRTQLTPRSAPWANGAGRRARVVRATSVPIHDIGTAATSAPTSQGWAAEWGWSNPFAFYFAGRGGMLGDVSADVVASAFGWFDADAVARCSPRAPASPAPPGAAARMAEAHGSGARRTMPT